METIQEFTRLLLILIPSAGAVRVALCLLYMAAEEDKRPYQKRMRNALIFIILAESIVGIMNLAAGYFGGIIY